MIAKAQREVSIGGCAPKQDQIKGEGKQRIEGGEPENKYTEIRLNLKA